MRADRPRVGVRCDAGPLIGVGHLMRCLALAEELLAREWEVVIVADLGGLDFARRQLAQRGLPLVAAPADAQGHLETVRSERLAAVVIDSYLLAPDVSSALVDAGVPVLALIDGPPRGQRAHLYLDQNLGAQDDEVALPSGAVRLAGSTYALVRDQVRVRRKTARRPGKAGTGGTRSAEDDALQVVVAFGGTDALGVTELVTRALVDTAEPFQATVVTADAHARAAIAGLGGARSRLTAVPPFDDFPRVLAGADLVVGAAGTSAWDCCCLGRPTAAAAVVDNQRTSYARLVEAGAVIGLGELEELRRPDGQLTATLARALTGPGLRAGVAERAAALVDGDGRVRVADALAELVVTGPVRLGPLPDAGTAHPS